MSLLAKPLYLLAHTLYLTKVSLYNLRKNKNILIKALMMQVILIKALMMQVILSTYAENLRYY